MNAVEARKQSKINRLIKAREHIASAVKHGQVSTTFFHAGDDESVEAYVIGYLQDDGYRCKREKRDGNIYLTISW